MAVSIVKANIGEGNYGTWVTLNSNIKSAQSSANILNPTGVTSSNVTWAWVGPEVRFAAYRVRYTHTGATIGTQPVICLYSAYADPDVLQTAFASSTLPTTGTMRVLRTDNVDSDATGMTVTLDATNDQRDGTYYYSNYIQTFPTNSIYGDLLGGQLITAFVQTAATASAGSLDSGTVEALLLGR